MSAPPPPLVTVTENGLYCPPGRFHIDPWRAVETAVITHAHGDHLRHGSMRYLVAESGIAIARHRLGMDHHPAPLNYGERLQLGETTISLHPAGHILGSAQLRIEHEGQIWVVSGDYKRQADPTCAPFEPQPCDVFISEATFALPVYQWQPTGEVMTEIFRWWRGELRVGVSQLLVTRALSDVTGIERTDLAGRLMGEWQPSAPFWQALHAAESPRTDPAIPYPFFLASALEGDPAQLGARSAWQVEWKWDGIRGQLIRRAGECHLWSRGEERITERFPEIVDAAGSLPEGVVLDGEVVAWKDGRVQPFALLQQRIGRKKLTAAILASVPVRFLAYDVLELGGRDLRSAPLSERREQLEKLLTTASPVLQVSPLVMNASWEELAAARADSRQRNVEGLMLKALDSSYGTAVSAAPGGNGRSSRIHSMR